MVGVLVAIHTKKTVVNVLGICRVPISSGVLGGDILQVKYVHLNTRALLKAKYIFAPLGYICAPLKAKYVH